VMWKMVMAVVPRDQAEAMLGALVSAGHAATFTESRGGMLRQSQLTLFIAVAEEDLEVALSIICDTCRTEMHLVGEEAYAGHRPEHGPVVAELGGVVVFTWDLDRFDKY
jgi:uncharacterized protein YaaQ